MRELFSKLKRGPAIREKESRVGAAATTEEIEEVLRARSSAKAARVRLGEFLARARRRGW